MTQFVIIFVVSSFLGSVFVKIFLHRSIKMGVYCKCFDIKLAIDWSSQKRVGIC